MNSSVPFSVYQLAPFEKEAAKIISSYPAFKQDLIRLRESLSVNPEQGKHLGSGVYKIRLEITGKPAGKSYGARVIYVIFSVTSEILLLKVYDKSETKDLSKSEEKLIRKMAGDIRKQKSEALKKDTTLTKKKRR
jgi:hypothetical protein